MRIGSSIPNFTRSASRISGGILLLVASSPNGSPGASASSTKRMRLMPSRLGRAMTRRLTVYFPIRASRHSPFSFCASQISRLVSRFPVPACELPQIVVPAAEMRGHTAFYRRDPCPGDDGLDVVVADDHLVQLDVHRRQLHRIELLFGLFVNLIVFLALPARNVAALPLVFPGRRLPRQVLVHEDLRIGLRHGGVVHLRVAIEMRVGVGVGGVGR